MNNKQILDLTVRLQQALDHNYNVVHMDVVVAVISALEGTVITKEQLESTRLAKYINHLRRRTKCENLARRAKSLLKKWREMVGIHQLNDSQGSNSAFNTSQQQPLQQHAKQHLQLMPSSVSSTVINVDSNSVGYGEESHARTTATPVAGTATSPRWAGVGPTFCKSANSNVVVENERFEPIINMEFDQYSDNRPSGMPPQRKLVQPQPISFANLIPGFNKANTSTDIFNNQLLTPSSNNSTIVIDIQDSNSGSNAVAPVAATALVDGSTDALHTVKTKKAKKEKKKKKNHKNLLIALDDSVSCQQLGTSQDMTVPSDKAPRKFSTNNISEILTLSDSSMTTMFTSENGAPKLGVTGDAAASDLTFTGKLQPLSYPNINGNVDMPTVALGCRASESKVLPSFSKPHTNDEGQPKVTKSENIDYNNQLRNPMANTTPTAIAVISTTPSVSAPLNNADVKVPKKRGRKKGSKGVDAVIAKETTLTPQILMSSLGSGGKKVKTTRELYAEIQSRKLNLLPNSTTSSPKLTNWPVQVVPENTSCSESSLHSPRNFDAGSANATASTTVATTGRSTPDSGEPVNYNHDENVTDSESVTSNPSPGSDATFGRGNRSKRITSIESNSNSQLSNSRMGTGNSVSLKSVPSDIECKLKALVMQLPPAPSIEQIELLNASAIVPCTCEVIETLPDDKAGPKEFSKENKLLEFETALGSIENPKSLGEKDKYLDSATRGQPSEVKTPAEVTKPLKSIFDLDFDEDDDPLNLIKAEAIAAAETQFEHDSEHKGIIELDELNGLRKLDHQQLEQPVEHADTISSLPMIFLPTYQIKEDPECAAKQRLYIQTQKIAKFHINALHNCYIANINGNWDDGELPCKSGAEHHFGGLSDVNQLNGTTVVPKYGSLVTERIPKNLSDITFTKHYKPKLNSIATGKYNGRHFLGVAKSFEKSHTDSEETDAQLHRKCQFSNENGLSPDGENCSDYEVKINSDVKCESQELKEKEHEALSNGIIALTELSGSKGITSSNRELLSTIESDVKNETEAEGLLNSNDNLRNNQDLVVIADDLVRTAISKSLLAESPKKVDLEAPLAKDFECDKWELSATASVSHHVSGVVPRRQRRLLSCSSSTSNASSINSENSQPPLQTLSLKLRRRRSPNKKKKRKKADPIKKFKIKRIKIAINGDIATQRQISSCSSSHEDYDVANDESHTEEDSSSSKYDIVSNIDGNEIVKSDSHERFEDGYDTTDSGEFHQVVPSKTTAGSNHIVLTIKKTPSKVNSPWHLTAEATLNKQEAGEDSENIENQLIKKERGLVSFPGTETYNEMNAKQEMICNTHNDAINNLDDERVKETPNLEIPIRNEILSPPTYSTEYRILQGASEKSENKKHFENCISKNSRKLHNRLFLPQELFLVDPLSNCTRSSLLENVSCESRSESENEAEPIFMDGTNFKYNLNDSKSPSPEISQKKHKGDFYIVDGTPLTLSAVNCDLIDTTIASSPSPSAPSASEDDEDRGKDIKSNIENEHEQFAECDDFPEENNGLLESFNGIGFEEGEMGVRKTEMDTESEDTIQRVKMESHLHLKPNCDEYSKLFNNNNNNNVNFVRHNSHLDTIIDEKQQNVAIKNHYNADGNDDGYCKDICRNISSKHLGNISGDDVELSSSKNVTNKELHCLHSNKIENLTGMRQITTPSSSSNGSVMPRIQQFKEWHQVLQLRSYNDELLTVLPYVIME